MSITGLNINQVTNQLANISINIENYNKIPCEDEEMGNNNEERGEECREECGENEEMWDEMEEEYEFTNQDIYIYKYL